MTPSGLWRSQNITYLTACCQPWLWLKVCGGEHLLCGYVCMFLWKQICFWHNLSLKSTEHLHGSQFSHKITGLLNRISCLNCETWSSPACSPETTQSLGGFHLCGSCTWVWLCPRWRQVGGAQWKRLNNLAERKRTALHWPVWLWQITVVLDNVLITQKSSMKASLHSAASLLITPQPGAALFLLCCLEGGQQNISALQATTQSALMKTRGASAALSALSMCRSLTRP